MRFPSLLLLVAAGCEPAFDRPPHLVDVSRILAARAEPAEVEPGVPVTLRLLASDAGGVLRSEPVDFALCLRARDLSESTAVSQACLEPSASWIEPVGRGRADGEMEIPIPDDACAIFGSEPPPAPPGEPPTRPVDPDPTGGYYQPVRLILAGAGAVAFSRVRLLCALPRAPADVAREFSERYLPNQNPALQRLSTARTRVAAGEELTLSARPSPDARETYLRYDPASAALQMRTERLEVAWFATAGRLADDRSEAAPGAATETRWRAPEGPGRFTLWAVLRDDRGGSDWAELAIEVVP